MFDRKFGAFLKLSSQVNLVHQIKFDVGFVDILDNNAGILPLMSLREGKYNDYQIIMSVNVLSSFCVLLAILKILPN